MTQGKARIDAFVMEARELLVSMEVMLFRLRSEGVDKESLHALFRAAHTIKGSASIFELGMIVEFAHKMENMLELMRNDKLPVTDDIVQFLIECCDYMSAQVDAVESGADAPEEGMERHRVLVARMAGFTGEKVAGPGAGISKPARKKKVAGDGAVKQRGKSAGRLREWHISLRFDRHVLQDGMNPLSMLHYLGKKGEIRRAMVVTDNLPRAAEMDPELCYIGFELLYATEMGKADIVAVFEYYSDEGQLILVPVSHRKKKLGEILGQFAVPQVAAARLRDAGLLTEKQATHYLEGTGQPDAILVESGIAVRDSEARTAGNEQAKTVMKVDVSRLDSLVDLVGELVIAGAAARMAARIKKDMQLMELVDRIESLVDGVRDVSLQMRMVKIDEVFQHIPRVMREISREIGKKVDVRISGGHTELDKALLEKLHRPMLHILRNAVDHGVEDSHVRAEAGKPPAGNVSITAFQESGHVMIEVQDDGAGLDADKILRKAQEMGLASMDREYTEQEIFKFIFMPGFSTADAVTELSGRGVGMDVVSKTIQELHGVISVNSVKGKGTSIRMQLPLTLAIISGFQVIVGDQVMVIPLAVIEECINMSRYEVRDNLVNFRGTALPYLSMRRMLGMQDRDMPRKNMLVVRYAEKRAGILVDGFVGEVQAVIKPLGKLFSKMKGISGSAILGDGSIAMIVDVPYLLQHTEMQVQDAAMRMGTV